MPGKRIGTTKVVMRVYSGECRQTDTGLPTGIRCLGGEELRTGDIVLLFHQNESSSEPFFHGLTVVTSDQWQSYSDGTHQEKDGELNFFVMGIKKVSLNEDKEWMVSRVKSHADVVNGEHWRNYGFNFREEELLLTDRDTE